MASNAIGDIDGLLQGSDIADSDEDGGEKFEDRMLQLVLNALAGKNVEESGASVRYFDYTGWASALRRCFCPDVDRNVSRIEDFR